jgi:hypothetical protein
MWNDRRAKPESAKNVRIQEGLEFLGSRVSGRLLEVNPRIVYQNRDRTNFRHNFFQESWQRPFLANVVNQVRGSISQLLRRLSQHRFSSSRDGDSGAETSQDFADREPDPRTTACDYGNLTFERKSAAEMFRYVTPLKHGNLALA